jgi:hypothetical protein
MIGANAMRAMIRGSADLPWVQTTPQTQLQLLQVNVDAGLWVIRVRMDPGSRGVAHRHGGFVHGFTISGRWTYEEYPDDVYRAGDYHFDNGEHDLTVVVPDHVEGITDVLYICNGVNVNKEADGTVTKVQDARGALAMYLELCEQAGFERPDVIGAPAGA